jgi:hypothetical protein
MYDGPGFRVLRSAGFPNTSHGPDCRVLILSAHYGLISSWKAIDYYERKLDVARANELSGIGLGTLRDMLFMPVPAARGRAAFEHFPATEVFVWGGELYRRVVHAWEDRGAFGDVPVTYACGRGIGDQLQLLKRWLAGTRAAAVAS